MKQTAVFLLLASLSAFCLSGCGYAGPEKAVREELDQIQKLDEATIRTFVSYEDLQFSTGHASEIGDETTEAVKLFFKKFHYKIKSSTQNTSQHTATVVTEITNLDSQLLAKDLCRAIITDSYNYKKNGSAQKDLTSSFALLKECLESHTYPVKTTTVTIPLIEENGNWMIQESSELENQLVGGFVSYLADPYLLTPEEVLTCQLEPFTDFTAEEWKQYLSIEDIFGVGNEYADELDQLLAEQLEKNFGYEILNVTQDGTHAHVEVRIQSLDMDYVAEACVSPLLEYAQSTQSLRASTEEFDAKTSEILTNALKNNTSSRNTDIVINLDNNGSMWEVSLDDTFADALLGGLKDALETLEIQ